MHHAVFEKQLASLWKQIDNSKVAPHKHVLQSITQQIIDNINQGDLPKWLTALSELPTIDVDSVGLNLDAVTARGMPTLNEAEALQAQLELLHPWRKGPFQLFDTFIDTEWRSNMKWSRIEPHLPDLSYKSVLDVGCGNGYYLLRMAQQKPELLLGIEPGLLQNVQFWAVNQYIKSQAGILPLKMEHMPEHMQCFDVVFSMGVLYHRKSPIGHLEHLKGLLVKEGTLILETIVVDGDKQTCLIPKDRYAQMRNVWFLPSTDMLCLWLERIGMKNIEVLDVSTTTPEEQRSTEWMRFHSLPEFIDKETGKTIEGYDLPKRAIIKAQR
ncbi:tRNA 5-methoxyuridine(34)/uridine 5-oxyacetic acid(34) synthase CmoB [Marinicella rhabdoformis]|uniref:tRNA 5-methoxyuridine(34)/uridine 5-oxyacetic acid(34) synthase CmoB n=1 Tax=Marinicella rhabdoformis TaxID=2580566 RepID=UPI0012AECD89|nr:tRNA 5-methoxyuridine(34)/uridine 5-oxyacetic acid(34) synthase CmoB [Marinicella rhabdoformis]